MELLIEIYQEILDRSDFLSQIRMTQLDKYLHMNLKIHNFFDINEGYLRLLSDDILKNYKYVKKLNSEYSHIITDEGIKHMNLHTLDARYNPKITDKGIKHMR